MLLSLIMDDILCVYSLERYANHRAKRDELEHKLKYGAGNMENIEIMTPESDFC